MLITAKGQGNKIKAQSSNISVSLKPVRDEQDIKPSQVLEKQEKADAKYEKPPAPVPSKTPPSSAKQAIEDALAKIQTITDSSEATLKKLATGLPQLQEKFQSLVELRDKNNQLQNKNNQLQQDINNIKEKKNNIYKTRADALLQHLQTTGLLVATLNNIINGTLSSHEQLDKIIQNLFDNEKQKLTELQKNAKNLINISLQDDLNKITTTQQEIQKSIISCNDYTQQNTELLKLAEGIQQFTQTEYNKDKANPQAKEAFEQATQNVDATKQRLADIDTILKTLETKQKEFQELLILLSPEDMAEVNRLVTEAQRTFDAISVSASEDEGSTSSSSPAREELFPQESPSFKATPPQALLPQIFPQENPSFKAKPPQTLFTSQLNTQLYNFRKILQKNLKGLSPEDKKYPILQECLQDINSAYEQTRNDFPQDTLILKEKAQKFEASLSRFTRLLDYASAKATSQLS